MAGRCGQPKSVQVKPYTRTTGTKHRKKASSSKDTVPYWTCVNSRTGRTCGTHHRGLFAASTHRKELDRKSFRAGAGRPWDVQKRNA